MHYLKIAARKELLPYLPKNWPHCELSENLNGAYLAAVVVKKDDSRGKGMQRVFADELKLNLPLIEFDPAKNMARVIDQTAKKYEQEVVPQFLLDLTNFADQDDLILSTPGHHNGHFFDRHPAGAVMRQFFGKNYFRADISDSVFELGDTMGHEGQPLKAEEEAAKAYHADKVYFCTNGTTSANTICATAVLREGDLVLFDRNNHKSLYNSALVMTGAKPVYLPTDRNADGLIGPLIANDLDEDKIRAEIAKIDPAKVKAKRPFRMAVLQQETYDGVFYDAKYIIKKLGKLCDYILLDCAWGGYEQFVDVLRDLSPLQQEYGPEDPGILVTESVHKQQAGVAQASQILKKDSHLKGQKRYVDHKHFNHAYLKYVTTSYSYPVYSSLAVNAKMANSAASCSWWDETVKLGINFRKKLLAKSKLFRPFVPAMVNGVKWEDIPTEKLAHSSAAWRLTPQQNWHGFAKIGQGEVMLDPLKLTILNPGINLETEKYDQEGIPGVVMETYLHEKQIIPEKSDIYSTLYLITPGESKVDMQTLFDALMDFEDAYLQRRKLSEIMPQLVAEFPKRYQNYTLYQLCQEIHHYYQENDIFKLERDLFIKSDFQNYSLQPSAADREFNENNSKLVELSNLPGEIALEGALPYPPGVFVVAPGEKWHQLDVKYFQVLLDAAKKFPGFDPEVQGVYEQDGKIVAEVLK
ncbi:putative ornithine decarboxylase [Lactobacillus xujianguonis]|uniref:Putative ornithine decarboxylase n=1 Tax=Lactobacillus xujianguonis TaxID=2495899 RepID=A0A437SVK5_9LACO|nr:putative ornithine decarboxylase [Lactobacillus xujianguonis]RVU70955.1 putative ornithine decarboxylase [Lactobacillus xujianguonis]RVU73426.1 putative ornithine decarboxylase [Lactobacillus xujianguonis]